jgi:hypothetical protein
MRVKMLRGEEEEKEKEKDEGGEKKMKKSWRRR